MNGEFLKYSQELEVISSLLETLMLDLEVAATAGALDPVIQENTDHALRITDGIFNETRALSDEFHEKHLEGIQNRMHS